MLLFVVLLQGHRINESDARKALDADYNVAAPFRERPETCLDRPVIDGDFGGGAEAHNTPVTLNTFVGGYADRKREPAEGG